MNIGRLLTSLPVRMIRICGMGWSREVMVKIPTGISKNGLHRCIWNKAHKPLAVQQSTVRVNLGQSPISAMPGLTHFRYSPQM